MIYKKNKYVIHVLVLFILASCSSTSENSIISSDELQAKSFQRDLQDIYSYNKFFESDIEMLQQIIDNRKLGQTELRDTKLLKKNYQKILAKNQYKIEFNPSQKYSKKIIELIYQSNLPINITWSEDKSELIPADLLRRKIKGFCSNLYDDSISSINKEISRSADAVLVIYSEEYTSMVKKIKTTNSEIHTVKYDSNNFQEFAAEILEINLSKNRYKKISNLNSNQTMNFIPRSRSDIQQIVMFLRPQEFKAMIPSLRYHGGNNFKYINFVSSLEELNDPLQLLDYEDSYSPISKLLSRKILNKSLTSMEEFLEYGVLNEWMLSNIFKQAGVQSAKIDGATGIINYDSSTCSRRDIPFQKISSDLFSS